MGIILAGVLGSCEEKIDWELLGVDTETIVVDGMLTNEVRHQYIRLTRPFSNPNGEPVPVPDADVVIVTGNDSIHLVENPGFPGYYFTETPAAATINRMYKLRIDDGGKTYTAEAGMVPVLPANPPQFVKNPQTGLYRIDWANSEYNPFQESMYEAVISWEHLVPPDTPDSLTYARLMHYTLNTIDVSYNIFPQAQETVWFPEGSYVIAKKYSVTPEYGDYLRALLAETEWQGSLFEEARGNLPGNISNGGLGYFSACSVLADTLVVE